MLLRKLAFKSMPMLVTRTYYPISRFDKILHLIQSFLNKMSNEDFRSFKQKTQQSQSNNVPVMGTEPPKNALEAEKRFTEEQKSLSEFEKGRLKRIDNILGTKTYFHESRMYEQRLDSQYILKVSQLQKKYGEQHRVQTDLANPNMLKILNVKHKRKVLKHLTKLKVYPSGNRDIATLEDDPLQEIKNEVQNKNLIKFLSEEALFTRLALGPIALTMQSIRNQKLLVEEDGSILDVQRMQNNFIFNGQVYFRPQHLMSIYRVDMGKYDKKLLTSVDKLSAALETGIGSIQQVISLDQIYECLKNYYYDERVNEYLAKIQNNELEYFLTNMQISPDGQSAFVVIDLLNTRKQYVGLYKRIEEHGTAKLGIRKENVIFNFKPEVALRNNGELYYIQRSEEGLYTEFTKAKFSSHPTERTNQQSKKGAAESPQNQGEEEEDMITKYKQERDEQILFKCKPYEQLRIIGNSQAKFSTGEANAMSTNILLQLTNAGEAMNNQIYLVLHREGIRRGGVGSKLIDMQQITLNNHKLEQVLSRQGAKEKYKHIEDWQTNPKNLYTECHEIMEVGYLIIRYCFVGKSQTGDYLKYGHVKKYAKYATFVPYVKAKFDYPATSNSEQPQDKSNSISKLTGKLQMAVAQQNQTRGLQKPNKRIQNFQLQLPSQQSTALLNTKPYEQQPYRLQHGKQQLIYVCPQQQFMSDLKIKHSSISNVYLLINGSVQSVYNRNSLYVHPLRKSLQPYSLYLDGYPLKIISENVGSGQSGKIHLRLHAPLLSVGLEYTLWKKQIKEEVRPRTYTETITIKEDEADEIVVKILSNTTYISRKKGSNHENQPVILYLPSRDERLDDHTVLKLVQKGVMFIQIVKCRGIFGTNMIDLLRGSKQMYQNYIQDIYDTIVFIREHISEHVGVYAEGPSSCFATLILNIQENQNSQLFDCSVLHEGVYDVSTPNQLAEYYFGSDPAIFQKINPFEFQIYNPTVSQQNLEPNKNQQADPMIFNLSNILFSTLSRTSRAETRKFINKLRSHQKIVYETVFLKQFDSLPEKDIFNLAYLYDIMKQKLNAEYKAVKAAQMKEQYQKGEVESRLQKDREMKRKKNILDQQN